VTEQSHAVFLSYASQDAEAAQRICDALRAGGIEVWFDQSELRGGDAWDRQIREQIHDCRLFIPVISANSERRDEGYFRREWTLAADRTRDMAHKRAFLVPVVIDGTPERGASVPEKFHELQWTRLPGGETPPAFVERIKRLLSPEAPTTARSPADAASASSPTPVTTGRPSPWRRALPVAVAVLAVAALAYWLISKPWISKPTATSVTSNTTSAAAVLATAFNPPPHSIAVLPFVNMSGDKEQEYFSEGLTEELLNSLSRVNELQVAARTSSFSFQGEHPDISTIAHKLNVGAVLEGSVRRSAHTVRISAQLINAVTGFHVWSQTYDRDLGDVLALQTEIANAVASALKVSLLGDQAAKVELGGTRKPAALDAYLRGSQALRTYHEAKDLETAITAYTEAIRLDPKYALAFVGRSTTYDVLASWWITGWAATHETYVKAEADARKAIALAPGLGEAHLVLANSLYEALDFRRASEEYERALALAPGNAKVQQNYGFFAVTMGRTDAGIAAARRAVVLDPLNPEPYGYLGGALVNARQYKDAVVATHQALVLDPDYPFPYRWVPDYILGNYQDVRASCESRPQYSESQVCLAMVYDKLGRRADRESQLAKYKESNPKHDDWPQYAQVYAQWGDLDKAIDCLEAALQIHHVALQELKVDPLLDPLRREPRFQAIERALKFPN